MKIKTLKLCCAMSISLLLAACGGSAGDGSRLDDQKEIINGASSSSSGFSVSSSNSSAVVVDTISPAKLGYGEGSSFTQSLIGSNKPAGDLSAGGTVVLTVNVVSVTNTLVTTPVEITFNSPCTAAGEAILKVGLISTNKVTAENGSASIAYTANGCVGSDEITASASIDNKVVNARLAMPVASDQVQSIKFVDTTPAQISLAGTGGTETSAVRFQVVGATGAPMKNVAVGFELSTSVGGMQLTNSSPKTDAQGYASTTVQAGNIHTSVRVTATAVLSGIFTSSSQLIVSTGIPDQDSMSLSATETHPLGWDTDGEVSTITIRLADAFNNPPPLKTNVAFRTEGGSIIDGCLTTLDGSCNVVWTSGNPRPSRNAAHIADPAKLAERKLCVNSDGSWVTDYNACRLERAGRVTIQATAIGNESFIDSNGNGIFDVDDIFRTAADGGDCSPSAPILSGETPGNSSVIPCDDLSEAYLDKNESGTREVNEEFVDFTSTAQEGVPDNLYTIGNGKYNGVLCLVEGPLCTRSQVTIRKNMKIIMTSRNILYRNGTLPFLSPLPYVSGDTLSYATSFLLADENGHGVRAGTKTSFDTGINGLLNAGPNIVGPLNASDDPQWINVAVNPSSLTTPPSGAGILRVDVPIDAQRTISHSVNVLYIPSTLVGGNTLSSTTAAIGVAGNFTINGVTIDLLATDTLLSVIAKINLQSTSTNVTASNGGTANLGKLMLFSSNNRSITVGGGTLPQTAGVISALGIAVRVYNPSVLTQYP